MLAKEIMTPDVITVAPGLGVREAARLMTDKHLGGLPVVTSEGHLVGMLTESDLLHRVEAGTERRRTRLAAFFADPDRLAKEYTKAHGLKVHEVMSRPVVAVSGEAELSEVADTLDNNHIKRVPVVLEGVVVGIISRRDLVRIVGQSDATGSSQVGDDAAIQKNILAKTRQQKWLDASYVGFSVKNGVVETTGLIRSAEQHAALQVLIEEIPGVSAIKDNVKVGFPTGGWV